MAIAFSESTIVEGAVDGESISQFIDDLDVLLQTAGWVQSATVTGGYEYTLSSPQSLECKCIVKDSGTTFLGHPYVTIQFLSLDGLRLGYAHEIFIQDGRLYQATVGICQLFLSLPGYSDDLVEAGIFDIGGHAVCGGVPYIPPDECDDAEPELATTEAWWSSGTGVGAAECFRWSWKNDTAWSGCRNGQVVKGTDDVYTNFYNGLKLIRPAQPYGDFGIFASGGETTKQFRSPPAPSMTPKFPDDYIFWFDPLLAWGTVSGGEERVAKFRAQIWDAMISSLDRPLDYEYKSIERVDDPVLGTRSVPMWWQCWSHYKGSMANGAPGTYYGSLFLLKPVELDLESNYVY